MKKVLLAASFMTATALLASNASAQRSRSEIGGGRCNRMLNQFVFNKANVNALVALKCAALSHVENERVGKSLENSATMHHQWQTIEKHGVISVKGFCAVPLEDLLLGEVSRFEIDLEFRNKSEGQRTLIQTEGDIVGKGIDLEFRNSMFEDTACGSRIVRNSQLTNIDLGFGFTNSIQSMLQSLRTPAKLILQGPENWVQGNSSAGFDSLGVTYQLVQVNGRRTGMSMVQGSLNSSINIRSMDFLDYAEGGRFLAISRDDFGHPKGFLRPELPVNHRFASVSIEGGSQFRGCSSLVYDGELSEPSDANYMSCVRRIENSKLQQYAKTAVRTAPRVLTEAEKENLRQVREGQMISQKAQIRISQMTPKARNYSDRPGMYEQGRVNWSHEDRARGFVVQQRTYNLDQQRKVMVVVEHKSDANGVKSTERIEIPFSAL